jgi:hypothetical protein
MSNFTKSDIEEHAVGALAAACRCAEGKNDIHKNIIMQLEESYLPSN